MASTEITTPKAWLESYRRRMIDLLERLPVDDIVRLAEVLQRAYQSGRMIFLFGNGANAAHASHFACDLGKGASDHLPQPFRVLSLNDNTPWMTALGNDYSYEDVYVRQLRNYAGEGDIAFTMSVSGSSPNCVKAIEWAKENGLHTVAIVGEKRGELAEIADLSIVLPEEHYGRVEDVQIAICHMLAGLFSEGIITGIRE